MTTLVTCEVCPNQVSEADIKVFMTMKMCPSCYAKEKEFQAAHNEPAAIQARLDESRSVWNATLQKAKQVDQSLEVRTDLFNAETVALVEIQAAIQHDPNIASDRKQYVYTKTIEERIEHYQKLIFELGEEMVKRQAELRAAVTMFNNEVIKLRSEEREQFKLKSIEYVPPKLSKPSASKPRSVPSKKSSLSEIRTAVAVINQYIKENNIPLGIVVTEQIVQAACVSKNMTADSAIEYYKDKFKAMIPSSK